MNRHRLRSGRSADAGVALMELVVAMGLSALAAASIMSLLVSSGRIADRVSDDDPNAGVGVEWLTSDIQRATSVSVDSVSGGDATSITLDIASGDVTWWADGGRVLRTGPETTDMVVVDTAASHGVSFEIRAADGSAIAPTDAAAIADCGRLVVFELADSESTTRTRTVGLRRLYDAGASC